MQWIRSRAQLTSYLVILGASDLGAREASESVFTVKPSDVCINSSKLLSSGTSGSIKANPGLSGFRKSILSQFKRHVYYI